MSLSRTAGNAFVPFHNAILEHAMSHVEIMNAEVSGWEIYFQMGPAEAFGLTNFWDPTMLLSMALLEGAPTFIFF